eukprot:1468359-Pyramimonas_sp.AAC.1
MRCARCRRVHPANRLLPARPSAELKIYSNRDPDGGRGDWLAIGPGRTGGLCVADPCCRPPPVAHEGGDNEGPGDITGRADGVRVITVASPGVDDNEG